MTASQKNYKLSQSDHDAKSLTPLLLVIQLELEMDIGNGIRIHSTNEE